MKARGNVKGSRCTPANFTAKLGIYITDAEGIFYDAGDINGDGLYVFLAIGLIP